MVLPTSSKNSVVFHIPDLDEVSLLVSAAEATAELPASNIAAIAAFVVDEYTVFSGSDACGSSVEEWSDVMGMVNKKIKIYSLF